MSQQQQLYELFQQALDLPSSEQESWLDIQCSKNPELRNRVGSLLQSHRVAEGEGYLATDHTTIAPDGPFPDLISGYRISKKLGRGGMGDVFQARDPDLDKIVAIKIVRLSLDEAKNEQLLERFRRERRLMAKLEHPNVVRAMNAGEENGVHFLVMEYVHGSNLAECVARHGPYKLNRAFALLRDALHGLSAIASAGLVHRDIKPSNLVVRSDGQLKILDLGLAKMRLGAGDTLTSTQDIVGTWDYVAPEQIRASTEVDIRADIYSLGCTLYFMLCGHPPFPSDQYPTAGDKISAHLHVEFPSLRESNRQIPEAVDNLIAKMVAKEPDKRFGHPDEILERLDAFVAERPQDANFLSVPDESHIDTASNLTSTLDKLTGPVESNPKGRATSSQRRKYVMLCAGTVAVAGLLATADFFFNADSADRDRGREQPGMPELDLAEAQRRPDRTVAMWAFRHGARSLSINDWDPILREEHLPETPFKLISIDFRDSDVSNVDLIQLGKVKLPRLEDITLTGTQVTDEGFEALCVFNFKSVTVSGLKGITDHSMRVLGRKLKDLHFLDISNTSVTSQGLTHLHGLRFLRDLYVQGVTNLTEADVEAMQTAVPTLEDFQHDL